MAQDEYKTENIVRRQENIEKEVELRRCCCLAAGLADEFNQYSDMIIVSSAPFMWLLCSR